MAHPRKPRPSPLDNFDAMLKPERIEEAFARVNAYYDQALQVSFDTPEGVAGALVELVRQHGAPARDALEGLLCQETSLRPMLDKAAGGDLKTALQNLIRVLGARYGLSAGAAFLIAVLAIKAVRANAAPVVCEALVTQKRKIARYTRGR